MTDFDKVTKDTYAALLNRVAERLVQSDGKSRRLTRWRKVESWLKVRMFFATR